MAVLVTGGAGYIGSHTCVELLNAGEDIIVIDNFYNSKPKAIEAIKEITGRDFRFYENDCCDREALDRIFRENFITEVIHFAGYKAVGESCVKPIMYYENNINSTLALIETMQKYGCKKLVFSSSATVYGIPDKVPVTEDFPLSAINPYGSTKLMIENMCRELYASDDQWSIILLRYFNPIGAHESGKLGEDPNGIPNNLVPYIAKVAVGALEKVHVFGNDYPTPDGTGVRDYIHVVDLARGHVCAIKKLETNCGLFICNLGTGKGYSVLDVIHAFEKACGKKLPYVIDPRRPGDIAECYADPTKAKNELGWVAEYGIEEMCADSWNWQKNNPDGYHTVK